MRLSLRGSFGMFAIPIVLIFTTSSLVAGSLGAGPAFADDEFTVCASGCAYTTIQAAITNSSLPIVTVGPGTYVENVDVTRPVSLVGAGQDSTVIEPATSNPSCSNGSLCGGSASNIVLVDANNVTISHFTLNGDNPHLTGVVVGGKNVDATNGIISDYIKGTFNGLSVHDVTAKNIYHRGIYAASGGTFDFSDDTVSNVQGNSSSIAMFNFGGSGTFADNVVTDANDAISSNYSTGVTFRENDISRSGSGIHTDNAGGATADVIRGNVVRDCQPGGYGIFVFVPYNTPSVSNNIVRGCSVGLALFGGFNTLPISFNGNSVNNSQAAGSVGVLATSDEVGYGCSTANASFTNNVIKNNGTGVQLIQGPAFTGDPCATPGVVNVSLNYNNIFGDSAGLQNRSGQTIDATNNWWGCAKGPNTPGCDTIVDTPPSVTNYTPFLTDRLDD